MNENPHVTKEDFLTLLNFAQKEKENTQKEYDDLRAEHKIPIKEIIAVITSSIVVGLYSIFANSRLSDIFPIFWLESSLLILGFLILRSMISGMILGQRKTNSPQNQISDIQMDKKKFLAYSTNVKLQLSNFEFLSIPLSIIFILDVIVLTYLFVERSFYLGLTLFGVFVISIWVIGLYGGIWFVKGFMDDAPTALLVFGETREKLRKWSLKGDPPFKLKSNVSISKLLFWLFMLIIAGLSQFVLTIGPIILSILLFLHNISLFLMNNFEFLLILLSEYLIFLLLQVFLTRSHLLKFLDKKIALINRDVIIPLESNLSDPSVFLPINDERNRNILKNIRKNYLNNRLFSPCKFTFLDSGYFERYGLEINPTIINNEADYDILEEYTKSN